MPAMLADLTDKRYISGILEDFQEMLDLLFVHWNVNPVMINLGFFSLRWYSVLFVSGFILGWFIFRWFFRREGVKEELLDSLLYTLLIGTIVGARLGHCIFYQPDYYFGSWQGFLEIFMPWKGGLASHGGTIVLFFAMMWYAHHYGKKNNFDFVWILDHLCIAVAFAATFIRLGNLMNSEIIGKVTDVPWAFIFTKVDQYPRHPGQLYEAIAYALFFFVGWFLYKKAKTRVGTGLFFGLCLTLIFTFRFFVEFTKDIQVDFEAGMPLDMGQLLSIPFVILGVACMKGGKWMGRLGAKQ